MIINLYFIRHIPTGWYIRRGSYSSRGSTHYEPCPFGEYTRWFYSEVSAKRALACWLRGEYESDNASEGGTYWTGKIKPKPNRIASEFEIIKRELDL